MFLATWSLSTFKCCGIIWSHAYALFYTRSVSCHVLSVFCVRCCSSLMYCDLNPIACFYFSLFSRMGVFLPFLTLTCVHHQKDRSKIHKQTNCKHNSLRSQLVLGVISMPRITPREIPHVSRLIYYYLLSSGLIRTQNLYY